MVNEEKGNEGFFLDLELYDLESIKKSIKDFQEVAKIVLREDLKLGLDKENKMGRRRAYLSVMSKLKDKDDKEIFLEFCNYVLGTMRNKSVT